MSRNVGWGSRRRACSGPHKSMTLLGAGPSRALRTSLRPTDRGPARVRSLRVRGLWRGVCGPGARPRLVCEAERSVFIVQSSEITATLCQTTHDNSIG
eukprot:3130948-Prymnesium_polylepis.1